MSKSAFTYATFTSPSHSAPGKEKQLFYHFGSFYHVHIGCRTTKSFVKYRSEISTMFWRLESVHFIMLSLALYWGITVCDIYPFKRSRAHFIPTQQKWRTECALCPLTMQAGNKGYFLPKENNEICSEINSKPQTEDATFVV